MYIVKDLHKSESKRLIDDRSLDQSTTTERPLRDQSLNRHRVQSERNTDRHRSDNQLENESLDRTRANSRSLLSDESKDQLTAESKSLPRVDDRRKAKSKSLLGYQTTYVHQNESQFQEKNNHQPKNQNIEQKRLSDGAGNLQTNTLQQSNSIERHMLKKTCYIKDPIKEKPFY